MSNYATNTMERLFTGYQFENQRINKEDAAITKKNITNEIYRRVKTALELLEEAETETEALQIYKQFIEY